MFEEFVADWAMTVIALVIAGIGVFLLAQWKKLGAYIQSKKQANEQELLWTIAQEAYVKAESFFDARGREKMAIALDYAFKKLERFGKSQHITADEMQTKIEEAWTKLEKIPKGK